MRNRIHSVREDKPIRAPVRTVTWLLRAAWALIAAASLAVYCASLYYEWQYPRGSGMIDLPTNVIISALEQMGIPLWIYRLYRLLAGLLLMPWFVMGILIFAARPDEWVVMLFSIVLIMFGTAPIADSLLAHAGSSLLVNTALLLSGIGFYGFFISFPLFPDGHLQPRWMRWPMGAMIALVALDLLGLRLGTWQQLLNDIMSVIIIICFFYAQVYRYRHADAAHRQQMKWAVLGFTVAIVTFFGIGTVLNDLLGIDTAPNRTKLLYDIAISAVILTAFASVPVSMGFAILRYRLWDVDVIIRRTLVYSVITGILATVYFSGVTLFQAMFSKVAGSESPLAIVASTLIIAALFTPVRRRVQDVVDRRFYRRKYDAEKTIDSFASAVRDEVDIKRLQGALLGVVEETMQPEHVSLWLRERGELTSAGRRGESP